MNISLFCTPVKKSTFKATHYCVETNNDRDPLAIVEVNPNDIENELEEI